MVSLANSTRATQKGLYHKTKHGFDLFGLIDPNMVMRNPPFPDELVKLLREFSANVHEVFGR